MRAFSSLRIVALLLGLSSSVLAAGCGDDEGAPYIECESGEDCGENDACFEITYVRRGGSDTTGSVCSHGCDDDGDCALGGVCLAHRADPAQVYLCYLPCESDADCYAGSSCIPVEGMVEASSVCLPSP